MKTCISVILPEATLVLSFKIVSPVRNHNYYLMRNATGKDLPPSDLDGMMNGLLEDRQRTPLLVIGGRPHPSHSRT